MEPARPAPGAAERGGADLDGLLTLAGRGDQAAFEAVYDRVAAPVFGPIRRAPLICPNQTVMRAAELRMGVRTRERVRFVGYIRCTGRLLP
jgi:hypothetical protein